MSLHEWLEEAASLLDVAEQARDHGEPAVVLELVRRVGEVRGGLLALTEAGVLAESDAAALRSRVAAFDQPAADPPAAHQVTRSVMSTFTLGGSASVARSGGGGSVVGPRPPETPQEIVAVNAHLVVDGQPFVITTVELWTLSARLRCLAGASGSMREQQDGMRRWLAEQADRARRGLPREKRPPRDMLRRAMPALTAVVVEGEDGTVYEVRPAGSGGDGEWYRSEHRITPRPPAGTVLLVRVEDLPPVRVPLP